MDSLPAELAPLKHQVAGHPSSVRTAADGTYIVKPSLPLEVEFYTETAPKHFPQLVDKAFIPVFYGVQPNEFPSADGKAKIEQSIRVENITHGFNQPNVIDLKLGTQLFDPLDPKLTADKQARMEAEAARTTTGSDGLRLTGFTVYDNATGAHVATGKLYGKAIPSSELANGIRRFFPCSDEDADIHQAHEQSPKPPAGLPACVLILLITSILRDVVTLQDIVKAYEWRIYGSSLLVVYEGDSNSNSNSSFNHKVKLIDFAHARHLPGQGSDAGMLKGFATVIRLLEGRLAELHAL